jgi:cytochrome P450
MAHESDAATDVAAADEAPVGNSYAGMVAQDSQDNIFNLSAPQPRYAAMQAEGGALRPAEGMVMVASRAAVDEAFRLSEIFSSAALAIDLGNTRPLIPLSVDPPEHAKYRKLLDPLFAPKRMEAIEGDIAERANRFIDAFADRGACHFTNEYAIPFPSAIFLGLMGLPWDELETFLRLKDGILRPDTVDFAERIAIQRATGAEIYEYFDTILDQRAQHPEEDILTLFLDAEIDGDKLTREEILDICFLFLIAGLDTVTDSLTCFYAFLAQNPEHRRMIAADPSVIPAAVEELLRWESPVPGVPRKATQDTELAGCPVKAGDTVIVSVGSANVDPHEFPDAFDVRFDREVNRHIAFGGGVHRCLGSHLARRELRVTLREWHRRIPDYELTPGIELHYPPGLRSVENLELVW